MSDNMRDKRSGNMRDNDAESDTKDGKCLLRRAERGSYEVL